MGLRALAHELEVLFEDLAFHPDAREIGDPVQTHPRHHSLALEHVLLQHDPADRCHQRQCLGDLACRLQLLDLRCCDVPVIQPAPGCLQHGLRATPGLPGVGIDVGGQTFGREELLLSGDQNRAVDGQKRLSAADGLTRRAHVQPLDEPVDLGHDVRDVRLGRLDLSHGADRSRQRLPAGRRVGHAQGTLLLGRQVDRATQHGSGRIFCYLARTSASVGAVIDYGCLHFALAAPAGRRENCDREYGYDGCEPRKTIH